MHDDQDKNKQHDQCTMHLSCCLKKEPTPLSEKIQKLREKSVNSKMDKIVIIPGNIVKITDDMIIGDVIKVFPAVKSFFEEANPLGLKSKSIHLESIAIFLTGTGIDSKKLCSQINAFLQQSQSNNLEIR